MGCTCFKQGCCRCNCPPSKKRCCHCRHQPKVPENEDSINIDEVINNKEYNKWLYHTQVIEGRAWFYWITFHVDFYCWLLIAGNGLGVFVAHLIPILHLLYPDKIESWNSCKSLYNPAKLYILCVLVFHIVEITCVVGVVSICIYILRNWSFDRLDLFEKLIGLTNILTIALFLYEGVATWITFIRDTPEYQTIPLFCLLLVIMLGIVLGWYIQYNVYFFLRKAENWKIEYPKSEAEIVSLVRETYIDRGKIRVVGSKHSAPLTIWVDDVFEKNEVMMSLDYYTGVRIFELDSDEIKENDGEYTHRAVAKGGTCLGLNRANPLSTRENGLVYILEKKGFSLADLGGVVMQTVGGFTSMGCAGGTIYHDYYESIYSIRIIDGTGRIKTYYKPTLEQVKNKIPVNTAEPLKGPYGDPYWGVIVSMGLMGVISEITFNLKKSYNVLGSQIVWPDRKKEPKYPTSWLSDPGAVPDKQDGDGTGTLDIYAPNDAPNSLYSVIMNPGGNHKCALPTEYMRLFIWPQVSPKLVTVWKGHRETDVDKTLTEWNALWPNGPDGKFRAQLYHEVGNTKTGKGGVIMQKILGFFYNFFDHFTNINSMKLPDWAVWVVKKLIVLGNGKVPDAMYFGANWAEILPMDQEMWTKLMPIQFTELWMDIEDTSKAMNIFKEYWDNNDGLKHTGTFSWESYPAMSGGYGSKQKYNGPPGGAWLRPNYGFDGRPVFRMDVLWFDVKTQIPYHFYTPLWNKLIKEGVHFRPHWGKWLPGGNVQFPGKEYSKWRDYYKAQYAQWDDWMALRKELDPQNIFVNTYWADTLGIDINDTNDPFNAPKHPKTDPTKNTNQEKQNTEVVVAEMINVNEEIKEQDP